ncbi:uncharacterized protein [Miscanthus floridulus]|uniref:uncharacterized protein n=1 Tax=Miscanthus floridulus TaxID=154761 RepID=UPI0034591463
MEEDEVEEIVRDEPRPQAVRILRKHGEEIVIIEEEDTTKEFRRLETSLTSVMKQIKEISRVAEQRRQLIKRMESLAAENEKLNKTRNLSEKNIQRAQQQDAELGQMRQAIDQLRQEKAKEAERVDKLAEEVKGYRHKVKAQFDVLVQEAKV